MDYGSELTTHRKELVMYVRNITLTISILMLLGTYQAVSDNDFPLHGRISYDTGTLIKGAKDDDWSRATLNTLVLEGDTIWVDKGRNAEIELPGGVFLRMADASKARILQLSPSIVIQGIVGSFYIERIVRSSTNVEFVTPACRVSFDPETCTRIDIGEGGTTQISTRWGRAYVTTERGGNEIVVGGKQCWVDVGYLPSEAVSFALDKMDAFDRWSKSRSELISEPVKTPPKYIDVRSTTIGYADLSNSGEWILINERYYWRPIVVVNYVPYRTGYWVYEPVIGSVWIETYPFGYITTHYGRWVYYETYGWVWGFDPVWSPAWVATVRCGDYFIWTPVDFYCRPVVVSGGAAFTVGGLNFYIGACSYVPATYVYTCPWYVSPVPTTVVNYIITNPVNIFVWNIDCRPRPVINVPYTTSLPLVRDYNPPRTIRGLPYYDYAKINSAELASVRVKTLESSYSLRTSTGGFRSSGDTNSRVVRTAIAHDITTRYRSVKLENTSPKPEFVRFERASINIDSNEKGIEERIAQGSVREVGREIGMERFDRGSGRGKVGLEKIDRGVVKGGGTTERASIGIDTEFTRAVERTGNELKRDSIGSAMTHFDRDIRGGIRGDTIGSLRHNNVDRETPGDINRNVNNGIDRKLTRTTELAPSSIRREVGDNIIRKDNVRTAPIFPSGTTIRPNIESVERKTDTFERSLDSLPSLRTPVRDMPFTPRSFSRIDMDGEQKPRGRDSSPSGGGSFDTRSPTGGSSGSGGSSIRPTPTPSTPSVRPNPSPSNNPDRGNSIRTAPRSQLFDNIPSISDKFSPLNTVREFGPAKVESSITPHKVFTAPSIPNRDIKNDFPSSLGTSSRVFPPTPLSMPQIGSGSTTGSNIPSFPSPNNNYRIESLRISPPRIETPTPFATPSSSIGRSIPSLPSSSFGGSFSSGFRGRVR